MHVFLVTIPADSSVDTEKIQEEYPESLKLWDHNWLVAANQTVDEVGNTLTIGTKNGATGIVVNLHLLNQSPSIHGYFNMEAVEEMHKWRNK